MKLYFSGLWRHPDFVRLWLGQAVSLLGSQIGSTALTFTAILALGATPVQLGYLATARAVPVLLFGLLAGVWVDRTRRRPLMILADLGRALLLLTIPAAALFGVLRIEQLYVVTALVSALAVFFDVAYPAYLPSLVKSEQLVEGNSKLSMNESLAEIIGPALGGMLVQAVTAPFAILFDAVSFLLSALSLGLIQTKEPRLATGPQDGEATTAGVVQEIREGLQMTFGNPILRALLGSAVMVSFSGGIIGTLYTLYLVQELGLTPFLLGIVVGVGGVSALGGAFIVTRVTHRFGIGRTLIGARLISVVTSTLMVLAWGPLPVVLTLLLLSQAADAVWSIYAINEVSLQQALTPPQLLGRVHASVRFLTGIVFPAGALLGGMLGQTIGLRGAISVGLLIGGLSALWLIFSPVRTLEKIEARDTENRIG